MAQPVPHGEIAEALEDASAPRPPSLLATTPPPVFSLAKTDTDRAAAAEIRVLIFDPNVDKTTFGFQLCAMQNQVQIITSRCLSCSMVTIAGHNSKGEMVATADWITSRCLPYRDSDNRRFKAVRNAAYVHSLGVTPDHQGQGVGRSLMKYLEDYSRQRSKSEMCLHVLCSNTRAIAFYKKLGYCERGVDNVHPSSVCYPRLVMSKSLEL